MAEAGGNGGDAEERKNDTPPPDWELLSMSMSSSDIKSAPEQGGRDEGVSDATMHSQYFGEAHSAAPGEIFQAPPEDQHASDVIAQGEAPEGDDKVATGGEGEVNRSDLNVMENVLRSGFEQPIPAGEEKFRGPDFGDVSPTDVVPESSAKGAPKATSNLWKRIREHMKSRTAVYYSVAFVAVVAGLVIIGRRWHLERLDMEGDLQNSANEEKIQQLAQEISESKEVPAPLAGDASAAPEGSSPSTFFGLLRELF